MEPTSQVRADVLRVPAMRSMVHAPAFPLGFQLVTLALVVALIVAGLGVGVGAEMEELLTLRKTNLTTLGVWGLWWPGMIAVVILLGRLWCTVCPLELVNRASDAVARRVGWSRARIGKVARAGWFTVLGYFVLQLLVAGVALHRVPHYTAILLLVLTGGALLSGLLIREPRSFCRLFCPTGALLSACDRHTPVQLEMRDPEVCARCTTRDCVRAEHRYRFDRRSCPSLLRPFRRTASDGCVLCFQCAKVCAHDNVGFGLVADGAPVRKRGLLRPFEAAFIMVALGFVAHDTIAEVPWLDSAFHDVPARLHALLPAVSFAWMEAIWFLILFPMAAWASMAGLGYAVGCRAGVRSVLLAGATGAAPIVAMAHLAKAAAKGTAWVGSCPSP